MVKERKLYLKTFGCQMNDADSNKIRRLLSGMNMVNASDFRDADVILLNTCSIRWKAEHKVYSELGRFRDIKKNRPDVIIGVGGCVAQQEKDEMFKRAPHLDIVFGTHNIHRLPEMIREVDEKKGRVSETEFFDSPEPLVYPAPEEGGVKAFVNIMRGCDNYCAYCIVPYVRGREISRPSADVIDEVKKLAEEGVCEVTLLGQNVNSYGNSSGERISFPMLIRQVAEIDGIRRVRFATSHPKDISNELIGAFGEVDSLCKHLHLPVQSGSDTVLKAMKRAYTVESYLEKIDKLRSVVPDIALTTDIIVGFPGETEDDFEQTLTLMKRVRFNASFSFKYSKRPGTAAARLEDSVLPEEKDRRLALLQALQKEHSGESNMAETGKTVEVLVEGFSKKGNEMVTGRTSGNKVVNLEGGGDLIGRVLPVRIVGAYANSLKGEYSPVCA